MRLLNKLFDAIDSSTTTTLESKLIAQSEDERSIQRMSIDLQCNYVRVLLVLFLEYDRGRCLLGELR